MLVFLLMFLCVSVNVLGQDYDHPQSSETNICANDRPKAVYCYCDYVEQNAANKTTCWVYGTASQEDEVWVSFGTQKHIKTVEIFIRSDGLLDFIPKGPIGQLKNLQYYIIQHSNISRVTSEEFSGGHALKKIELDDNQITELQPHAFKKLKHLLAISLSQNKISKILRNNFVGLPSLKKLYIDRNNLSVIEDGALTGLEALEELELYRNQIQNISTYTFRGLKNLQRLDLNSNELEYIDGLVFRDLGELRQLILSSNRIRFISEDALVGLESLVTLDLSDNKLTGLGGDVFLNTPSLHFLDLKQNVIETMTERIVEPIRKNFHNNAMIVRLGGNNLVCDCRLGWMYDVIQEKKISSFLKNDLDRLRCFLNRQAAADILPDTGVTESSSTGVSVGGHPLYETTTHSLGIHIRLFDIPKDKLPCEDAKTEPCVTENLTPEQPETKSLDGQREGGGKHKHKKEHRRHKHGKHGRKKDRRRKNKEEEESSTTKSMESEVYSIPQPGSRYNEATENRPEVSSHHPDSRPEQMPNEQPHLLQGRDGNSIVSLQPSYSEKQGKKQPPHTEQSQGPKSVDGGNGASSLQASFLLLLSVVIMLR